MRHHAFVAAMGFLIAAVLVSGQAQAASADPTGYWRKAEPGERPGKFHIFRCGRGNQLLCAKIIWLQDPLDSQGRPLHDVRNENPAMRDRPIMGLPIINGMQQVAGNQWKGSIYNPEDGNTYSATLTVVSRNQINVKGCKAWLLCGERTWLRTSPPPKPEPEPEPEIEASAEPDSGTEVASEAEEEKPNALSDADMLEPAVEHPTRPGYRFLNTGTDHETPAGFGGENVDSMFVMTKPIASETDEATESAEADPAASAEDAPQSASEAAPPTPTPAPAAEPKPEAQPKPAPQSMQANAAPTPRTTPAPQAAPADPESDAAETQTAETDLAEEPPLTWRERRLLRRQQKRGLLPWLR